MSAYHMMSLISRSVHISEAPFVRGSSVMALGGCLIVPHGPRPHAFYRRGGHVRSIMVVGEGRRLTTRVRRGSMHGRLRRSRLCTSAVVPQPLGRLRESDDEASGPPMHKGGLGGDP
jgi:hypothetical protein